jgi:hypothetical protein
VSAEVSGVLSANDWCLPLAGRKVCLLRCQVFCLPMACVCQSTKVSGGFDCQWLVPASGQVYGGSTKVSGGFDCQWLVPALSANGWYMPVAGP